MVARAYASRGLLASHACCVAASVLSIGVLGGIFRLVVIFAENGLGNDIFFRGPVAEIAVPATFAAKWKISMNLGIGWCLTNRTSVLHGSASACLTVISALRT